MLVDKRLCPETIRIRDYRIAPGNSEWCPDTINSQNCCTGNNSGVSPMPAAALARDIIDGADLAIVSISMRNKRLPLSGDSLARSLNLAQGRDMSSSAPHITEVRIGLSPRHQGQGVGFSLLRDALLRVAPYWLEQVFHHAPKLEKLKLSIPESWDTILSTGSPVAQLKQLRFSGTELHAQPILTVLANSKHSLTDISFHGTTLKQGEGSTWRELLSSIGDDLPNLTCFRLVCIREADTTRRSVRFKGFRKDRVADEHRSGLTLCEVGGSSPNSLSSIRYDGPNAGVVLKTVAAYAT